MASAPRFGLPPTSVSSQGITASSVRCSWCLRGCWGIEGERNRDGFVCEFGLEAGGGGGGPSFARRRPAAEKTVTAERSDRERWQDSQRFPRARVGSEGASRARARARVRGGGLRETRGFKRRAEREEREDGSLSFSPSPRHARTGATHAPIPRADRALARPPNSFPFARAHAECSILQWRALGGDREGRREEEREGLEF